MIHPHTSLKFRILITVQDFDQKRHQWTLVIKDQFHRVVANMVPSMFLRDTEGNYYFTLQADTAGLRYFAATTAKIPDGDYPDGFMAITDYQPLCSVGIRGSRRNPAVPPQVPPRPCPHHGTDGMEVVFTRVFTKSIDDVDYLCDEDGNFILTSDGRKIAFLKPQIDYNYQDMADVRLNMTGEKFKELIEGNDPNGQINTLPEVINAMNGISDDTTIKQDVEQQIADEAGMTYEGDTRTLYINGAKPKPKDEGE